MWEVKAPGATAYILGTMHLAPTNIFPLPPAIEWAFDHSSNVVIEKDMQAVMEKVVYARNVRMTERIETYLARGGTYFVMVGAAHVVGERGIVARLRRLHRYTIRQR